MGISGNRGLFVQEPVNHQRCGGLLSVVQGPYTPEDNHWQAGLEFEDSLCAKVNTTLADCQIPAIATPPAKSAGDCGENFRHVDPFTVYSEYKCAVPGIDPLDGFTIAKNRLIFNEQKGVEATFWTGVTPAGNIEPSLAFGDTEAGIVPFDLTPAGGAVDIVTGIAMLESAMGNCIPGLGVIHANIGITAYLAQNQLLKETLPCIGLTSKSDEKSSPLSDNSDIAKGGFYSPLGTQFALGAGYPTSGPGNVAAPAGEMWVFATGPVIAWRSEIFMTPPESEINSGIDRKVNNQQYFAERTWALGWSCCEYAIRVKIQCGCGC